MPPIRESLASAGRRIVIPSFPIASTERLRSLTHGANGFRAVGPGRRGREWRSRDGDHFVFEQSEPVQTYLFSFGVARLAVGVDGMFSIYAQKMDANKAAFAKTADAYAFL